MAEINAAAIKSLREKTGAGMMDCKKALEETSGNFEKAVDWLRTKGREDLRLARVGVVTVEQRDVRAHAVVVL